jgi:hypothetical protein
VSDHQPGDVDTVPEEGGSEDETREMILAKLQKRPPRSLPPGRSHPNNNLPSINLRQRVISVATADRPHAILQGRRRFRRSRR